MITIQPRMKKPLTILFLLPLISIVSCSVDNKPQKFAAGRIDYKITYLNQDLDEKTIELLPRRMRLSFDENQAVNNIEGFLGVYRLNSITNFDSRKCSTLLKIFEKQYVFMGRREELICCFDAMEGMNIEETRETKIIAGLNCKKARISLPSNGHTFDIFYTGDIKLHNPNSTNPYRKIDGVLLEFELTMLHLKMRFTAENFEPGIEIPSHENLPDNVKTVSREQMTQILNRLMN